MTVAYHLTLAQVEEKSNIIGSKDSTPLNPFGNDGFYLNKERPAPSNGTIKSVQYCYYGRRDTSVNTYQSLVALYRPGARSTFDRVSDTLIISKRRPISNVPPGDVLLRGFNCDVYELETSIQVQKGDVIGACIYDNSNIGNLDLISRTPSTNGGYTLFVDSVNRADCDSGTLPSKLYNDNFEGTMDEGILHVSAEICESVNSYPCM